MYRIAIVEDDMATSDMFSGYLENSWPDCLVDQFTNFESASDALARNDYDLVISDIDLGPGSDRFGGAKISKALHSKHTPLLIVSGLPQPELHRELFKALDAWDYLQKPVTESDFLNQVARAITFSQTRDRNLVTRSYSQNSTTRDPNLCVDLHSRAKVIWKGERVNLSLTQIRIVETLVAQSNGPVAFGALFEQIDSGRNKENLRVHIGAIRREFKAVDPEFDSIHNIPMLGYMWRV